MALSMLRSQSAAAEMSALPAAELSNKAWASVKITQTLYTPRKFTDDIKAAVSDIINA